MTQSRAEAEWGGKKGLKKCCNWEEMLAADGAFTLSVRLTVAGVGTCEEERACGTSGHADLEGRQLEVWIWLELGQQTKARD